MTGRLLLVVDQSRATKRAVSYVARLTGGRRGFRYYLAHALPPLPPDLLEFQGAEDPEFERQLDTRLRTKQERWLAAAKKKAGRGLLGAEATLRDAGVPASAIEVEFLDGAHGDANTEAILKLASKRKCDTIVIGRQSVSRLRQWLAGELSEDLVRRGRGFSIWVVE